ncbi:MAG: hypothetical protein ACKVOM_05175 [Ferruginibacter sp.]
MANSKSESEKKISNKKAIINKIKPLIVSALEGIEKKAGEKKFENGVNKAAKLLAKKLKLPANVKKADDTEDKQKAALKTIKQASKNKTSKEETALKSSKKKELIKKGSSAKKPNLNTQP